MAGYPTHGRARVDPSNPQAFAVCDRCKFLYNHVDLTFQFEWRGDSLQNTRFLVCAKCLDVPNEQNRPIILPPDPVPIRDPRPEFYDVEVDGDHFTLYAEDGVTILFAEDGVTELQSEGAHA